MSTTVLFDVTLISFDHGAKLTNKDNLDKSLPFPRAHPAVSARQSSAARAGAATVLQPSAPSPGRPPPPAPVGCQPAAAAGLPQGVASPWKHTHDMTERLK